MFPLHSDKAKISKNIRRMEKTLAMLADFCSWFLPERIRQWAADAFPLTLVFLL
jgi:hypothetical protein